MNSSPIHGNSSENSFLARAIRPAPSLGRARSGAHPRAHSSLGARLHTARTIRTDYVVVSPHNLREPSGLARLTQGS